jgi:thiol-disulfide isomerase/thioredoxin
MNQSGFASRRTVCKAVWLILLSFVFLIPPVLPGTKRIGFAIPFPEIPFEQTLSKAEGSYLGIPRKPRFLFREIRGSLILVEFASSYCGSCQKQAPILNEVYRTITRDEKLKNNVKMIGIAAGNNLIEVENFKKEYEIPYPIFADPKFNAHTAIGSPRAPFLLWVRRDETGKWFVVSTHLGLIESAEKILNETRAVFQYNLALLKPKKGRIYEGEVLKPPLSDEELTARVRESMEASGGKVLQVKTISLKDGDRVYAGNIDFGTHRGNLFSKLVSRRAVCDICHDTFFIYTFDPEGEIVEITPVELTKVDNLAWSEEDVRKLKSRVIGKSILQPFPFNPHVDAVSGATVTAVLIFDSLDKAREIYEALRKGGYIQK